MNVIDFYKFIEKCDQIEWVNDELLLWVDFGDLGELAEMLGQDWFVDSPQKVYMMHDCVVIDIVDICDAYNFDPELFLTKEERLRA